MGIRMMAAVLIGSVVGAAAQPAGAQVVHRDLQEWLDVQGTSGTWPNGLPQLFGFFNDPDINEDGIPDGPAYVFLWDYADVAERVWTSDPWGTEVTGSVTERPLGDGTSHYTVSLHVTNASIWVVEVSFECVKPPNGACLGGAIEDGCTVFGFREQNVAFDGETPALASGRFQFDYIAETDAPLTNLFSEILLSFKMQINADGPLMFEECGVDTDRLGRFAWGKPGLFAIPPAQDPTKVHGAGLLFPNDDLHLFEIRRGRR